MVGRGSALNFGIDDKIIRSAEPPAIRIGPAAGHSFAFVNIFDQWPVQGKKTNCLDFWMPCLLDDLRSFDHSVWFPKNIFHYPKNIPLAVQQPCSQHSQPAIPNFMDFAIALKISHPANEVLCGQRLIVILGIIISAGNNFSKAYFDNSMYIVFSLLIYLKFFKNNNVA
jgi:hypothetical protein